MTLLHWTPETGWHTSQVANIISALTGLITFLALCYAWYQGKKNKIATEENAKATVKNAEAIAKLAGVTDQLSNQNQLIVDQTQLQHDVMRASQRAEFTNLIVSHHLYDIDVEFTNTGEPHAIDKVKLIAEYMEPKNDYLIRIGKNQRIKISIKSQRVADHNTSISLFIDHSDVVYGFRYRTQITGRINDPLLHTWSILRNGKPVRKLNPNFYIDLGDSIEEL
jgi:hypothetical protein